MGVEKGFGGFVPGISRMVVIWPPSPCYLGLLFDNSRIILGAEYEIVYVCRAECGTWVRIGIVSFLIFFTHVYMHTCMCITCACKLYVLLGTRRG